MSPDTLREVVCDLAYIAEMTQTMDEATEMLGIMSQRDGAGDPAPGSATPPEPTQEQDGTNLSEDEN